MSNLQITFRSSCIRVGENMRTTVLFDKAGLRPPMNMLARSKKGISMTTSVLCFDIGGTTVRAALSRDDGAPDTVSRYDTPADDHAAFISCLKRITEAQPEKPAAVAISLAGVVNPQTQKMIIANIPAINGTDFASDLEETLGIPIVIANDADCFAVAEAVSGAGKNHDIVFGIILGTGVGGGLVCHGHLINRNGGFAGEWGHGPVAPLRTGNPPVDIPHFRCGCGQSGCLDTIAGGRGLERLYRHLCGREKKAPAIVEDWRLGAKDATRTVDVYLGLIAGPLALTVNLTGATIVPAGGGLSSAHDLLAAIDRAVRPLTLWKFDRPLIVPAESGAEPGLAGAAIIARQHLERLA